MLKLQVIQVNGTNYFFTKMMTLIESIEDIAERTSTSYLLRTPSENVVEFVWTCKSDAEEECVRARLDELRSTIDQSAS